MPHDDDRFRAPSDNVVEFPNADEVIARLAELPEMEYEQQRKAEAKRLGVRATALDNQVKAARVKPPISGLSQSEPWDEPVDGDALLDALVLVFREYIVMEPHGLQILALWAAHTYCFSRWQNTPRLYIRSPKKRSGKSRVLDVLDCIVAEALRADGLSAAVVFRLTEDRTPTWLVDETDQWLDMKGELIGILNSGHAKGQKVYRCVGDEHQVQAFNVFAPVALAGIGKIKSDTGP